MSRPGKKKEKKKKLGGVKLARVPSGYIASISSKGKLGPAKIRTGSPIPPRPPFSHEEASRPGCDCFHTMYSVAGRRVVSALRSSGAIKLFFSGVVWSAAQNPAILRPRLRPRLARLCLASSPASLYPVALVIACIMTMRGRGRNLWGFKPATGGGGGWLAQRPQWQRRVVMKLCGLVQHGRELLSGALIPADSVGAARHMPRLLPSGLLQ